jgi:hypothetical protein
MFCDLIFLWSIRCSDIRQNPVQDKKFIELIGVELPSTICGDILNGERMKCSNREIKFLEIVKRFGFPLEEVHKFIR